MFAPLTNVVFFAILAVNVVPGKQQATPSKGADESQRACASTFNTSNHYQAKDDTQSAAEKPKGWHKLIAWPEGITTWAIILTLCAIAWQSFETRRAVDIATNAQRSWIVSEDVDDPDLTNPWIQRIGCHFKVFGSSPVRVLEAKFRLQLVPSKPKGRTTEPDLPGIPDYGVPSTLDSQPAMGRIRAPGEEFTVFPSLESLFLEPNGKDIEALKAREKFLCVYGFIRYRDGFSKYKERETRFCYVYNIWDATQGQKRPDGFDVGGPPAYNEVR